MLKRRLFLLFALLCAVAQGAWAQADWDEVYSLTNTTSSEWTQINAGSTTGRTLGTAGTTTYLYVNSNLSFTNSTAGGSGLTIQGTVYLYVPSGVTLTCTGANASGMTGAGAGIELASGNTLYLLGLGSVNATGGNAANGGNGGNGGNASGSYNVEKVYPGNGGAGGNGGGGAGAGVGTRGGSGGAGGSGGVTGTVSYETDVAGAAGGIGSAGSTAGAIGSLYVANGLTVNAAGGSRATVNGHGGSAGGHFLLDFTSNQTASGGAGGGGGGYGGAASNIGTGGPGGGGGGGGSGGSARYKHNPGYYRVGATGGGTGMDGDGSWHNDDFGASTEMTGTQYFNNDSFSDEGYDNGSGAPAYADGGVCGNASSSTSGTSISFVGSETTTMTTGIYAVLTDVTVPSRIQVNGNVTLKLGEGATLHAPKGFEVSYGNSLTINGPGALTIDNCDEGKSGIGAVRVGTIVINGGTINAKGGLGAAGIGGDKENYIGGYITINGGVVNAYGGNGAAIGGGMGRTTGDGNTDRGFCGVIHINGGQVSAFGNGAAGIGPGWTYEGMYSGNLILQCSRSEDFVYSTGYESGYPTIGLSTINFENAFVLDGTTTIATSSNIGGQKIVPYVSGQAALSGSGTEGDPWLIYTTADWNALVQNVLNENSYSGQYVKLMADIDITKSVGVYNDNAENARPFSGTFLGNNHTLTVNLTGYNQGVAPFRYINGATIKDLTVEGTIASGQYHTSGLVGFAGGTNLIDSCTVSATLNISSDYAGGLVGHGKTSSTTIKDCIFSGTFNGVGGNRNNIGAIWGWNDDGATPVLQNCLEKGTYTNIASMHPIGLQGGSGSISQPCYYVNPQIGSPSNAWSVSGAYRVYADMPTEDIYYGITAVDGNTYYFRCPVSGIAETYNLNDGVSITPVVTDPFTGNNLAFLTDYTATLDGESVAAFPVSISTAGEHTLLFTGQGSYSGSNSFGIVVFSTPLAGEGTAESPYLIGSNVDWCLFASNVNSGTNNYSGKYLKLTADISVSTMVGASEANSFRGTFLGDGHTLTFNKGTADKPFTEPYCAPFRHVRGANIRDLHVAGHIYTSNKYAAGLVSKPYGSLNSNANTYITNCRISTVIHSSALRDGTHGGISALPCRYLFIIGCVYDGRMFTTNGTTDCGGIVGWGNSDYSFVEVHNSLYAPDPNIAAAAGETPITSGATIVRGFNNGRMSNCYYTEPLGSDQGAQAYTVTPGNDITIENAGTIATATLNNNLSFGGVFDVSGLTVYTNGFKYNGVLYGGSGSNATLVITSNRPGYIATGYMTSAGTLTGTGSPYTLAMPGENVTISATGWTECILSGLGTENDPYLIGNTAEWNAFVDYVNSGIDFYGKYFKLTADISVTTMAGTSENNSFRGTFLGDGHTLTFAQGSSENAFGEENCAPFRYVKNATIQNLKVAGSIYTSRKFAGGLVARSYGTTNVTDCQVGTVIYSIVNGDGTHGGIVAMPSGTLNITGSVYDGRLLTNSGTTNSGGIVAWHNSATISVSNTLYAPGSIAEGWSAINTGSTTFVRGGSPSLSMCFYTETMGDAQGTQAYSITAGDYVTVANSGDVNNEYDVSGLTFYATGIKYNDVLYAASGNDVSLTLGSSATSAEYQTSAGTLSGSGNSYMLAMPAADVVIGMQAQVAIGATVWSVISTPMHDADATNESIVNVNNLTDGSYDLLRYDEANGTWENQKSGSGAEGFDALEPGRGYIYRRSDAQTLTYGGVPNSAESYSVTLTASNGAGDLKGFNLVGNPYPFRVKLNRSYYSLNADGTWMAHPDGDSLEVGQGALVYTESGETLTFYRASRNTNGGTLGALPALPKGLCLGESSEVGGQNPEVSDAGGTPALQFAHVDGDQVVIDGTGLLQAYDMMGRMVKCVNVEMRECVSLPMGVYVLRLNGQSQKIVIK